ncbi:TrbI/VirB10 family protein [Phenylobacterium sp.]|uniref:TrbI/VirB10 family protein n=1 Tax=Phenylobacterium sp. TaxID=1871053 RepID=UPI00289B7C25|nr:TrbI/VirB10 family protein [Phenylobacterium sp.]
MSDVGATAASSADLRLRAAPGPVVRLSRRVILMTAGGGAVFVFCAAALAMTYRPSSGETRAELVVGGPPPEAIRLLPADYRHPKLGDPLPGDLGPSMLAAAEEPPSQTAKAPPSAVPAVAEADAARRSPLFLDHGERRPSVGLPLHGSAAAGEPAAGPPKPGPTSPARLREPVSPYIVQAGAVIPAAMVTGLRSDLPGQAIAQVTQPVFDTPTGQILLIPQGARLIGSYDARLTFAQRRILLSWTRLMLPNGKTLDLEALPAGDAAGQAGLEDRVDHRWSTLLGTAGLSTLLSIGAEIGADDDDELTRAIRRGAVGAFNQAGRHAVEKGLSVSPILTIRPGAQVRALVTHDLLLERYEEQTPWPKP